MSNRLDKPMEPLDITLYVDDGGRTKVYFQLEMTYREFQGLRPGDAIIGTVTEVRREVIERGI